MVICIKCGLDKEKIEFYTHKKTKDGIIHKCKECTKEYIKNLWTRKENDKKREQTEKRRLWKKQYIKKFYEENPEKRKAQLKVSNFLRFNKDFKRNKCIVCEKESLIHYHHFDYTKPMEIIPCCPSCHYKFHHEKIEIKQDWILKLKG